MKKIFLDMDGVIVDFVGGVCKLVNYTDSWIPGEYDLAKVLRNNIWDIIDKTDMEWWSNLDKTTDADAIINAVEKYDYYICSSPTCSPLCAAGKLLWIQKHYPKLARKYVLTPHKHLLATRDSLLIDDSDVQCQNWTNNGGLAYLIPRMWNSEYSQQFDPYHFKGYVDLFME